MQANHIKWHILFWVFILLVGTATVYPYYQNVKLAFINRAIFLPVWLVATYVNWLFLMPRYLDTRRFGTYIGLLLAVLFVLTIIQRVLFLFWFFPFFFGGQRPCCHIWQQVFHPGSFSQFAAFIALPVLCSIGIYLLRKWYLESYKAKQIIAQQQAAELNYLKAQINPHFLFNVLNNIYGLSLEESKKVPNLILKLSDILSYSLYEASVDSIALEKEVKLIEDFIDLERERYENRVQVHFEQDAALDRQLEIAPLLLIPLVENAFKHGVMQATEALPISIFLGQKEGRLIFEVKNKMPEAGYELPTKKRGLGLKNLKRRLDLLYPEKYSLEAAPDGKLFRATLKLELE